MSSSHSAGKTVDFDDRLSVRYIERRRVPNMGKLVTETFNRHEINDDILAEAAKLFNENYGVWGVDPTNIHRAPKKGNRVKLSEDRLRQYLPEDGDCSYVKFTVDGKVAGNAFACRWKVGRKTICWITQLVVHREYRQRGIATALLVNLRRREDDVYGIMSSHPAACLAAARAFGEGIGSVSTAFIRDNADSFMKASPVEYVKGAELRGEIFDANDTSGAVSSVCTNFFVDHAEPLEALESIKKNHPWPLGELLDGDEFLLMVESRMRS